MNTSAISQMEPDGDSTLFGRRFWRCRRLLQFIACRILNEPEQVKKAVENCWHSASARAPHFEYEGAFRSWLLRVLIDEALLLLRQRQQTLGADVALKAAYSSQNCTNVVGTDGQRWGQF
jgi:DNA-directed RNA polymerase specialized sigma24 family protein